MVRATLDDRKTHTRRVIKKKTLDQMDGRYVVGDDAWCPYGKPGDRLWVREGFSQCLDPDGDGMERVYSYRADNINKKILGAFWGNERSMESHEIAGYTSWKPSIHMARWASRINLEITNIRVERVQDITHDDAIAEGLIPETMHHGDLVDKWIDLWDSINKSRGYGWDINPWVWVVEFKRINES